MCWKPRMDDPSNPMPSAKRPSESSSTGIEKCCCVPGRSTKRRSTILTCCSFASLRMSLGEVFGCAGAAIARRFEVTRPAISQHLRVLKEAGLVTERRNGTKRLYRARPETIAELRAYLEAFWDDSLRSLKAAAEQEEQQRRTRHGRRHESH